MSGEILKTEVHPLKEVRELVGPCEVEPSNVVSEDGPPEEVWGAAIVPRTEGRKVYFSPTEDLWVSTYGRIRTGRVDGKAPCGAFLKTTLNGVGRPLVDVKVDGTRKMVPVYRLVIATFGPPPESGKHMVCHRDGDCLHNHISNLYWGDFQDNADDKRRHQEQHAVNVRHVVPISPMELGFVRSEVAAGNDDLERFFACFGHSPEAIKRALADPAAFAI
jgi:hypothetical protein